MKYHHIFGPVISRRLGISLGVDLVTHKICSLDCVYCECGKTTQLTTEQKEYVVFNQVKKELDHFWEHHSDPDYITFSGSGEPTLNNRIGHVIDYIKAEKPHINVAVLTNATLFPKLEVRKALLKADLIIPSLDAISKKTFARINRPEKQLDIDRIVKGIEVFSKEYRGKIWLEVFILPGINDKKPEMLLLKEAIKKINPDRIQLNTLDRPGTVSNIQPASKQDLEKAAQILGSDRCEIIAKAGDNKNAQIKRKDGKQAILETIHRRPCTKKDIMKMIDLEEHVIDTYIKDLEKEKKIIGKMQARGIFYQTLKEQ